MIGSVFHFRRQSSLPAGSKRSSNKRCPLNHSFRIYRSPAFRHFSPSTQIYQETHEWLCPCRVRQHLTASTRPCTLLLAHRACRRASLSNSEVSNHLSHQTPQPCLSNHPAGTTTSERRSLEDDVTEQHTTHLSIPSEHRVCRPWSSVLRRGIVSQILITAQCLQRG